MKSHHYRRRPSRSLYRSKPYSRIKSMSKSSKIVPESMKKLVKDLPEGIVIHGDGTSHEKLLEAGIAECDVMVAVAGADETNLVVSTLAKLE